jgi:hypothetical protein
MKKVNAFKIVDHGVDHEQYFPGCGVACTEYIGVATGVGDSAHEAMEDALDQLAMMDWEVDGIKNDLSEDIEVPETSDDEPNECHYYISVRVK